VYALLHGKTLEEYTELLQAVVAGCGQLGFHPDPSVVITDFELSVMRATEDVLGTNTERRGCFYHLTQSIWRKVNCLILKDLNNYRLFMFKHAMLKLVGLDFSCALQMQKI